MNLNNIDSAVFLYILEDVAQDMVRKCMRFNRNRELRFVEMLSQYAGLCLVNQRFNEFMPHVRVDGKLLKAMLMERAITNFQTLLLAGDLLDCETKYKFHVPNIEDLREVCGPVWKNPLLWDSLGSTFDFCDMGDDHNWGCTDPITPHLLYWIPRTFKKRIVWNPNRFEAFKVWASVRVDDLDLMLGSYKIETEKDVDSELEDMEDWGPWTGISLTRYSERKEGAALGEDMGECKEASHWLWYRRYDADDVPDYIYMVADYEQIKVMSPNFIFRADSRGMIEEGRSRNGFENT
jgi:hypothetical protein